MTNIKFPKRREDGSFTVLAKFAASGPDALPVDLLRDYVAAWTRAHRSWVRIWRSDVIDEEPMVLAAEFSCDPRVEVGYRGHALAIVFEGNPSAQRWKDWVVMLVDDVVRMFFELKFEGFES